MLELGLTEDDDPDPFDDLPPVGVSPSNEPPKPAAPGDRIGRYRLVEQIGKGGFGVVFKAEQEEPIRRLVALKVIKLGMDTQQVIARFEAERQALALMDHPNIAKVLDAGADATGRPYFVMELVQGTKITDYCDEHKLSLRQRLALFIQVCQAVQHAHQKGVIHRDIKPSNVLVSEANGVPVPKVIDFGIARATENQRLTEESLSTAFAQFLGTPAYMSPEQAGRGGQDIDSRSDIYSLGMLLYELLTAQPAFDAEILRKTAMDEVLRFIREEEPPRPSARLTTLTPAELDTVAQCRQTQPASLPKLLRGDLDWIVMRAVEKDRSRRYETANGLALDIQRFLDHEPVLARPPSRLYRFQKVVRRNRLAFAAASMVLAALIVGLGLSTWLFLREKAARQRAVAAEATAKTEVSRSVEVARFLKDMVTGVGPAVAQGQDTKLLRGILDKTSDRIEKDLKNQPEVAADLKNTLGTVYEALGEYDKAETALRAAMALKIGKEADDAKMAALLDNLGVVMARKGKWTEAETMHRRALLIQRSLADPNNAEIAKTLGNLGNALWYQDKFTEAEPIYHEALTLSRQVGGEKTEEMATAVGNMGVLLARQGKAAEAEPLFREALGLQRKLLGTNHPQVAKSLSNLGSALVDQGKLAEAEPIFQESVDIRRRVLGNEHPALAFSLNNLGGLLMQEGKFAEAEAAHREALAIRRKRFGDNHPDVAFSLNRLAGAVTAQGKFAEAEALYREALALRRKLLGDEHLDVIQSLNELGMTLNDEGKVAEAETNLRQAVTFQRKLSGDANADLAKLLRNLAFILEQEGKPDEQEKILREALAVRQKLLGEKDPAVADSLSDLADVLEREGKLPEAETTCREALALREKVLPGDWVTFDARSQLGGILAARTNYAEATPLLLSGYEGMKQHEAMIPVPNKSRLKDALQRLVRLYESTGNPAQAAEWRKKLETAPIN
jgi:serine/threonine protein kinase/Tfp pilus assembly protein PilF